VSLELENRQHGLLPRRRDAEPGAREHLTVLSLDPVV
jgi:hypothetical protein